MIQFDSNFRAKGIEKALAELLKPDEIATFTASFSQWIAMFRLSREIAELNPAKAAQEYAAEVRELAAKLEEKLSQMPASVKAYAMDSCYFDGYGNFGNMLDRMGDDLVDLGDFMRVAEGNISVSAGRPDSGRRDRLLYDVVEQLKSLGITERSAIDAAGECLKANRVELPAERSEVRRLYRGLKASAELIISDQPEDGDHRVR